MAASKAPAPTKQQLSTNNYIIVLVLVSLLVVGVGFLASKALIKNIGRDGKVLSAKSQANNQLDTDLQSAPELVQSFQGLAPGSAKVLAHALPNNSDFPGLISMLETAATTAGLSVTSVSPDLTATALPAGGTAAAGAGAGTAAGSTDGSVAAPTPQTVNFSTQVSGSYAALVKFFHNVELAARPMRVTSVQMSGTGSSLTGTVSVTTYYQDKATLPFSTRTIK